MPCLILLIVLGFPRLVLVLLFFFSTYLQRAYHGILIPILGFFFLPLTTLCYAWMMNSHLPLEGVNVLILIVAVLIDVGGHGGAYSRRRG